MIFSPHAVLSWWSKREEWDRRSM